MLMRGVVSTQSGRVKKQQRVKTQRGGAPPDQRSSRFPASVRSWRRRIPSEQPKTATATTATARARNCPITVEISKFGDLKADRQLQTPHAVPFRYL